MAQPGKPQLNLFSRRGGPRVRSVSELTDEIKGLLEGRYATVWVAGEISNFRRQSSGHCYFSLKDDSAQLSAVLFRGQARYLRFDPKDGLEVLAKGRISVYAPRGQYQLIVDHLEPRGVGALQAAFEQLKATLEKEGLFAPARKVPVPFLPRKVGVVTSPTGAAVRDFLRVAHRRHPGMPILVAPARVQGAGAAEEVARQVRRLDERGDCDVIVVTRGGGSIEDLWAFNEEVVARAIAACRTPVVSAVGHEIDFTIADFVADKRSATPSAAAEEVVPDLRTLQRELRGLGGRVRLLAERDLEARRGRLERLFARAGDPRHALASRRLALEALRERGEGAMAARLRDQGRRLAGDSDRLRRAHPRARLQQDQKALHATTRRLLAASPARRIDAARADLEARFRAAATVTERRLAEARRRQAALAATLDALSPLKVLERGYGLVRTEDGKVVRRAADLKPDNPIRVDLARGRVRARVTDTEDER